MNRSKYPVVSSMFLLSVMKVVFFHGEKLIVVN